MVINAIITRIDSLTKYCRPKPCFVGKGALSATSVAKIFFDNVVRSFGAPGEVVSDRAPSFTAFLWYELWALLGTKLIMSSAYHPQTDG